MIFYKDCRIIGSILIFIECKFKEILIVFVKEWGLVVFNICCVDIYSKLYKIFII